MSSQGIEVYHAPLETPEAIGRVERHGGVLKGMARKVLSQTQARGEVVIQSVLDESCLTKNSLLRNGGYSPSQWVLGKTPREAPSLVYEDQFADLCAIEDQVNPESRFAFQHQARLEAKKAFIHLDTSKRVQRALLRSATPVPQTYSVGDVVCFRRDNQPGKTTWSPASRVIRHEGDENQNVWVLCENILVLVSAQNIRPAGDAEALAHAILHGHSIIPEAIVRGQQDFEDATAVPAEDSTAPAEGSMSTATHVAPPQEDDGPLPSILENKVFDEPEARRERSRSPVPERAAASSSRRVIVLQSQTPSVHLHDAPHAIPRTICPRRYVITLSVLGKVRLPAMTKDKHPLLCAVELSSLHLWLIGFLRKNRLSISVSSRPCPVTWTTVGSPPLSNLT